MPIIGKNSAPSQQFSCIENHALTNTITMFKLKLLPVIFILSCSVGCDKSESEPAQSRDEIPFEFLNNGIIKAESAANGFYILSEVLSPLIISPGDRILRKINSNGAEIMRIQSNTKHALIDFCSSDNFIFVVRSSANSIEVQKYNLNGAFLDSKVVWENSNIASISTHDRARIAIRNNTVSVAFRAEYNSVLLTSLDAENLEINWSTLIEPENYVLPTSMTGGSYDTFEQLAHPYMVFLDLDQDGNAYVVVPALYGSTIYLHNQFFSENLSHVSEAFVSPGFESDALVTKVDIQGERVFAVVAGSIDPDECYGIKTDDNSFYLFGRSAKPTSTIGYEWDGYLAQYNSSTGNPIFISSLHVDQSSIVYDIAKTDGGKIVAVGATGWTQNPLGYSVSEHSRKMVAILDQAGNFQEEFKIQSGLRHNQVRTIINQKGKVWLGGWENGPGTHSGDNNPQLVYADAFWQDYLIN